MNVRTLAASALLVMACPAWAWPQTGNNYAGADAQLNRLYQRITANLPPNSVARQKFVQSQRAWIGFRDAECRFASSKAEGGSIYVNVYQSCLERLTWQRVSDFNGYLYHLGRGDAFDPGAHSYPYNQGSPDAGAVIAGAVAGVIIGGVLTNSGPHPRHYRDDSNYAGCHGIGCMVDNPDEQIDTRPQFDRNGNPNFDTHGNYQGCHGSGCMVESPDYNQDAPPEPAQRGEQPHFSNNGPPEPIEDGEQPYFQPGN